MESKLPIAMNSVTRQTELKSLEMTAPMNKTIFGCLSDLSCKFTMIQGAEREGKIKEEKYL
jgi:hypothetical protein